MSAFRTKLDKNNSPSHSSSSSSEDKNNSPSHSSSSSSEDKNNSPNHSSSSSSEIAPSICRHITSDEVMLNTIMQATKMGNDPSRLVLDYYMLDLAIVTQQFVEGILNAQELGQFLLEGFRKPNSNVANALNKLSLEKRSELLSDTTFPRILRAYYSAPTEFIAFLNQDYSLQSGVLWHINQVMKDNQESKVVKGHDEAKEYDEEFWMTFTRDSRLRQWSRPNQIIYGVLCREYPQELIHALAVKTAMVHLDIFHSTVRTLIKHSGQHLCLNGCNLFSWISPIDFSDLCMPAANLVGARIGSVYDVDWQAADLTNATFAGRRICGVNFQNAILEHIKFDEITSGVGGPFFQRCDFLNATIDVHNRKRLVSCIHRSFELSVDFSYPGETKDSEQRAHLPVPVVDWNIFSAFTRLFKRANTEYDLSTGSGGLVQRINHFFKKEPASLFNFQELVHLFRATNAKSVKDFEDYVKDFPSPLKERLKNETSTIVARLSSLGSNKMSEPSETKRTTMGSH